MMRIELKLILVVFLKASDLKQTEGVSFQKELQVQS